MNINLHIAELIVEDEFSEHHQKYVLKNSLEASLKQLLSQNEIFPNLQSDDSIRKIHTKPITIEKTSTPSEIGQNIAHSVYQGIRQ